MLLNSNLGVYKNALNAATMRQNTIANNIANVDTPNFKGQGVTFESQLQAALGKQNSHFRGSVSDSRHVAIGEKRLVDIKPQIFSYNTSLQNNGNNVDIDYEMSQMAENQLWYNALVQQTNGYFQKMSKVINGLR